MFRLGQQRLEAWPEYIGLIAGGHDDGEKHRRSSFPRISCAARGWLHAAFLNESRTPGRVQNSVQEITGSAVERLHRRPRTIPSVIEILIARSSACDFFLAVTLITTIATKIVRFCAKIQQGACGSASVKPAFLYHFAMKRRLGQMILQPRRKNDILAQRF